MKTIAILLLSCLSLFGAGKKFTDYPPITNAGPNDLLLLSEFTGSATNSKSLSITNLNNSLLSLSKNGPYVITNNGAAEWLHIYYGLVFDTISSADVFSSAGGDPWSFRAQTGTSVVARLGVMTNAINAAVAGRILSDTGSGTNTTLSKGIIFDYLTFGSGIYFTNTVDGKKWTFTGAGTNDVATLGQLTNLVQSATNGFSSGDTLTNIAGANINISTNGFYRVFTATNTYQSGLFGDGSDGHLNFDGVTTPVGGATLSGGVYTMTKTLYASSIQVTSSVTLRVFAWRILCTGIITNLGTIQAIANGGGNGGANGTNGAAASSGGAGTEIGGSVAGAIGGLGSATTGGNSPAGTASTVSSGGSGSRGGAGGLGAGVNAGGTSGAAGTLTARPFRVAPSIFLQSGVSFITGGSSGSGGGAGGGDSSVFGGGGGGSGGGGGVVGLWAWGITNNGTISANGGAGGNGGSPASGSAGGGAGGGGGGGGFVYANYAYASGPGTWTASGGTGGTGGTGQGTGLNGAPGTNGAAGLIIRYNVTTRLFE